MKKFKRTTAAIMCVAMAMSMVACKKGNDSDDATPLDAKAPVVEDNEDWPTTEEPVIEDNRFTTVEGADAIGLDFEDGIGGFTTYTNGGQFTLSNDDGQLVANIEEIGSLEHACQMYFDGFTMAKGCVYTVSFDISSSVDRVVEWRVQINGGDYHAYASDKIEIGPETQTITMEFTMEDNSDPAPRFVINMGAFEGMGNVGPHKICVDNLSLFVTDSSNAEKIVGAPRPIQVKVNQIGYKPDDVKTVVVTSEEDEKFKIVDAETEETVYIGEYGDMSFDKGISCKVKQGDFSDFTYCGRYKIISSPSGASYEFSIGEDLYADAYADVVKMLYSQRCGCELDPAIVGEFAHKPCHTDKALVYGDDSGKTYDVSGGWHDAGDYGKYVVPGAKTVMDLFLAYEDYDQDQDDIGIPESGNGVPDLLDEARYELDWMLKMQDEKTGGVYHKVTALNFPETVLAVDETATLYLAPISYAATGDFCAVMAKASELYKDIDKDFAEKCYDAAEKAYGFLEANEGMKGYKNPDEIVTGEYLDNYTEDELLWASAEMYIVTGDQKYADVINELMSGKYQKGLGWASIGTYALYDLAKSDSVDEKIREAAKAEVINEADKLVKAAANDSFFMSLGNSYPWGSNMNVADNGVLYLMAYKLDGNKEYRDYAQRQRDYIFGVNGTGYCYVTGYGSLSPEHPHHRPSEVLEKTLPGMLVGGPNNGLNDPYAAAVLYGVAPGLCYVDNSQSFSCNEITIYWNSPLIYLMTGLE